MNLNRQPHRAPSAPATPVDVEAERRLAYQQGYDEAATFLNQQLFLQRRDVVALADETLARLSLQEENLAAQARQVLPDLVMEIVRRLWAGFQPDAALVRPHVGAARAHLAPGPGGGDGALPPGPADPPPRARRPGGRGSPPSRPSGSPRARGRGRRPPGPARSGPSRRGR